MKRTVVFVAASAAMSVLSSEAVHGAFFWDNGALADKNWTTPGNWFDTTQGQAIGAGGNGPVAGIVTDRVTIERPANMFTGGTNASVVNDNYTLRGGLYYLSSNNISQENLHNFTISATKVLTIESPTGVIGEDFAIGFGRRAHVNIVSAGAGTPGTLQLGTAGGFGSTWRVAQSDNAISTVDVTARVHTANLTSMLIGVNTRASTNAAALGVGDVDLTAATFVPVNGSRLGDMVEFKVGTLTLGDNTSAVGMVGIAEGTLHLGAIDAEANTVNIGDTGGTGGSLRSSGLLDLQGTEFYITTSINLIGNGTDANSNTALGQVQTQVLGESAGLDLAAAATISAGVNSLINIVFAEDPNSLPPGDVYWGLRWQGDHVAELEALAAAGKLTWDDSALTVGEVDIFLHEGVSYVAVAVPEPTGLAMIGLAGALLGHRARRKR